MTFESLIFLCMRWFDLVGRHGDGLAAALSLSARGRGRSHFKGAPEPGVLLPDGEVHACSYEGPCARMWLQRHGALPELVLGVRCASETLAL
jgi:hypothetical protein